MYVWIDIFLHAYLFDDKTCFLFVKNQFLKKLSCDLFLKEKQNKK